MAFNLRIGNSLSFLHITLHFWGKFLSKGCMKNITFHVNAAILTTKFLPCSFPGLMTIRTLLVYILFLSEVYLSQVLYMKLIYAGTCRSDNSFVFLVLKMSLTYSSIVMSNIISVIFLQHYVLNLLYFNATIQL